MRHAWKKREKHCTHSATEPNRMERNEPGQKAAEQKSQMKC